MKRTRDNKEVDNELNLNSKHKDCHTSYNSKHHSSHSHGKESSSRRHRSRHHHHGSRHSNQYIKPKTQDGSDSDEWVVAGESENIYESLANRDAIMSSEVTDTSGLNRLKAELLKAELKSSSEANQLRQKYEEAEKRLRDGGNQARETTAGIKVIDSKLLHRIDDTKDDITVQEMIKDEILSNERGDKLDMKMAEQISRDGGYSNDLDYADENAVNLAKLGQKSEKNLRNQAIAKTRKLHEAIDSCTFCLENETAHTTIVSIGTRVYLCLAAEPTLAKGSTVIVPIEHHMNTIECDNDEWEEIRNFMKSLCQMWAKYNKGVLFYENAVTRSDRHHGCIVAVPISFKLHNEARGFFSQSILEISEEWSSHRKIIDTATKAKHSSPEAAKYAFRSSIAKEAPYFHVWFNINGGLGHIVEDTEEWPKNDQFARQVIGGMLQLDPVIVHQEGEFRENNQGRAYFEARWKVFDWTQALT